MISLLTVVIAYLIGSVSIGYLFARWFKGVDIRKQGSGNTGATNISRLMGFKMAVLVLILDALKGFIAVHLALLFLRRDLLAGEWVVLLCGVVVIAGHNWPLYFNFKGGRGAATMLGVFLALIPVPALIVFAVVVAIIAATRYVSLGSIAGAAAIPVTMIIIDKPSEYFYFGLLISFVIIFQHRENIKRLIKGKESKLGEKLTAQGKRVK
ncbi:MAG: glycerol-3-phosphate 1-O-acyltransferase PlsY [Bacillota bacterium]